MNRQKDQQISQLTAMMQQLAQSFEQDRESRRSAPSQQSQGPPRSARTNGGQGDLPRDSQSRQPSPLRFGAQYPSPQRFEIGSQHGDRDFAADKAKGGREHQVTCIAKCCRGQAMEAASPRRGCECFRLSRAGFRLDQSYRVSYLRGTRRFKRV